MQSVTQLIKKQPFPRVVQKAVSKNFAAFIEKHLKEAPTWLFYCELCKFFRTAFFAEHASRRLILSIFSP